MKKNWNHMIDDFFNHKAYENFINEMTIEQWSYMMKRLMDHYIIILMKLPRIIIIKQYRFVYWK